MVSVKELKQQVLFELGYTNVARIKSDLGIKGDARTAEFWNAVLKSLPETNKREEVVENNEVSTMTVFYGDSVGISFRLSSVDTSKETAAKILCFHHYRDEIQLSEIEIENIKVDEGDRTIEIEACIFSALPVRVIISFDDYYKLQFRFESLQEIAAAKKEILQECRERNYTCSWKFDPNFHVSFFDSSDRKMGKISQVKQGWEINFYDRYLPSIVSTLSVALEVLFDRHKERLESVDKLSNYLINKFN
jgi:hypothetical protein